MKTEGRADGGSRREEAGVDLRRLRYFFAVCDHGGFSKAAGAIGIAQPALTRHIKLLEQEIGVRLIERSSRGAAPSPQGRFLLDRSRQHVADLNDIVRETRERFAAAPQTLGLGVCPTIAPLVLDALLGNLKRMHPNCIAGVVQAYGGDLLNLLRAGRLDLIVTYRPEAEAGLGIVELFAERLVLARAAGSGLGATVALADIAQLPLILPTKLHELRRLIDRVAAARSVVLEPALELDSLDAVKAMLAKRPSRYATIVPHHSVRAEVAAGQLTRQAIDDPAMQRTVAVVVPSRGRENALVEDAITAAIASAAVFLRSTTDQKNRGCA